MLELYKAYRGTFKNDSWVKIDRYVVQHKVTGEQLWIANGWTFFTGFRSLFEGSKGRCRIPFVLRLPLWIHMQRSLGRQTVEYLKN